VQVEQIGQENVDHILVREDEFEAEVIEQPRKQYIQAAAKDENVNIALNSSGRQTIFLEP
jgi:hypothetical protein